MSVPIFHGRSVAVVDDDVAVRKAIGSVLQSRGFAVEGFASAEDLLVSPRLDHMVCIIVEVHLPGMGGRDLRRRLVEKDHCVPAIFIGADDDALEQRHAEDPKALAFLRKPFEEQSLIAAVEIAVGRGPVSATPATENGDGKPVACVDDSFSTIVGYDAGLAHAVHQARLLATVDASLLLQGETGVGKEVFARSIHENGHRPDAPFMALNCGGLPRDLLVSELFGYVDGAFTGARRAGMVGKIEGARGGTLFLDEIADMPIDLQPYLLRVLENGELYPLGSNHPRSVRFRLIAACNQDLRAEADAGRFRLDLFFRIAVATLAIPALRERSGDIPALVSHFVREIAARNGVPLKSFDPAVLAVFACYPWPGNVRELRNGVEAMMLFCESDVVGLAALPATIAAHQRDRQDAASTREAPQGMERVERDAIDAAIRVRRGNLTEVATDLRISKSTLYAKIKKYTLQPIVDTLRRR
jgi:DNA-binding NtrC family response regulator